MQLKNGRAQTRTTAQNTGKTACCPACGAESGATWPDLRRLLAECEDLPEAVRTSLISLGDVAVQSQIPVAEDR